MKGGAAAARAWEYLPLHLRPVATYATLGALTVVGMGSWALAPTRYAAHPLDEPAWETALLQVIAGEWNRPKGKK